MKLAEGELKKYAVAIEEVKVINEKLATAEKEIKNRDKQLEELKKKGLCWKAKL